MVLFLDLPSMVLAFYCWLEINPILNGLFDMSDAYFIRCLGVPAVFFGQTRTRVPIPRSALQLLLCLATEHSRRVPREHIMDAFWPDVPTAKAASRLTSALWRLRKALADEPDAISILSDGSLRLNLTDTVQLDISELQQQADVFASGDSSRFPHFLEDASWTSEPFRGWYAPWLLRERVRLENLREHCLRIQLTRQVQAHALTDAIETGERLLQIDPLLEDVHEQLIDIYLAQGCPGLAKRQFARCHDYLTQELGVAPSDRLAAKVAGATIPQSAARPARPAAQMQSACKILRRSQQDLARVSDLLGALS